jgi:hypothetical protein
MVGVLALTAGSAHSQNVEPTIPRGPSSASCLSAPLAISYPALALAANIMGSVTATFDIDMAGGYGRSIDVARRPPRARMSRIELTCTRARSRPDLRHSREVTMLCSPKVNHHHGELGGVLPPGKNSSCRRATDCVGSAPPLPAVESLCRHRQFLLRPERLTRASRRMMGNHPARLRRG